MRYLQKIKVMCTESQTQACGNIEIITQREDTILKEYDRIGITNNLQTTDYKRIGLIDGIGSLAKSLFGTMNAKTRN